MHTKTAFAAIAASIVLAACGTPYGSYGLLGGYTETQLADNVWQVTFEANGYTRQATTVRYAMLRCAELTGLIRRKPRISMRGGMRILRYHWRHEYSQFRYRASHSHRRP